VNFVDLTPEDKKYLSDNYSRNSDNVIETISQDGLTKTTVSTHENVEEFYRMLLDPVVLEMGERKQATCLARGISRSNEVKST
jgi:hypothetical protein